MVWPTIIPIMHDSRLYLPGVIIIHNSEWNEATITERAHYFSGVSFKFLMFGLTIGYKKIIS